MSQPNYAMMIAKFLTRETEQRFRHAVAMDYNKAEDSMLDKAIELLSEWAGKMVWKKGYELKELKTMAKTFDYGYRLGLGIDIKAERVETIRQFCYQFVSMAEELAGKNDELAQEIARLNTSKWIRFVKWLKILGARLTVKKNWRDLDDDDGDED